MRRLRAPRRSVPINCAFEQRRRLHLPPSYTVIIVAFLVVAPLATPPVLGGRSLIAAPLGIVFSRQGVIGSVAAALLIFFGMLVCENIFLALGQGMRIPAFFGAWTTNLLLACGGILALHFKSRHKELPKPGLADILKWVNGKVLRRQNPSEN